VRLGLLTGGGDCPGLNAVIRAVVRRGAAAGGNSFLGFRHGWAGVLEDDAIELTLETTAGILPRGGTILGTSRTNPFAGGADGTAAVARTLQAREVDALVPIGGEDTLGVALRLHERGIPVVGVPKTIDNDLGGTDVTFGFQTAVQIATDAIDRLHSTAESLNRVIVVEHSRPAGAKADERVAAGSQAAAHDRADDRVQAGTVPAAREQPQAHLQALAGEELVGEGRQPARRVRDQALVEHPARERGPRGGVLPAEGL